MKYAPIVWAGLRRKPFRSVLTFLSVMTAFLLYGGLAGTMASFDRLLNQFFDQNQLYTVSRLSPGMPLPRAHVERIERIPGVHVASGGVSFGSYYQVPANHFGGEAYDLARWTRLVPDDFFVVSEGALSAMQRTRNGVVVGKELAERFGWKIGDRLPLHLTTLQKDRSNVWLFDIVGTWDVPSDSDLGADQVWVNYEYYDEVRALNSGTVSSISTRTSDPAQAERIAQEIDRLFANSDAETHTQSMAAAIRAEMNTIIDVQLLINAVLTAVFFTLLFVIGNTMMQSVRERIPEFGVLKTYGFPDAIVSGLVVAESLVLCVGAALVGLLVTSKVLFPWIFAAFRMDPLPMAPSVVAKGIALAVALSVITALPPALRAGRLNIVDALAAKGR